MPNVVPPMIIICNNGEGGGKWQTNVTLLKMKISNWAKFWPYDIPQSTTSEPQQVRFEWTEDCSNVFCLSLHTNTHTKRPLVLLPAARFYNTPEEYACIREAIQYAILAEVEFLVPDLGLGLFSSDWWWFCGDDDSSSTTIAANSCDWLRRFMPSKMSPSLPVAVASREEGFSDYYT